MKKKTRYILIGIAVILLAAIGYASYLCLHFFFYDKYKEALPTYKYEKGTEYKGLSDTTNNVAGMELVAENDDLKLYTNPTTTEIAVYDKRTGETTYSNPIDKDNDKLATGTNKSLLNSQLVIDYYDKTRTIVTMNSYDLSTKNNQFKAESIKNGIRYTYTFGDLSSKTGIVPQYITEKRLQSLILDKLSGSDLRLVKGKFAESKTVKGYLELNTAATKSKIGMKKLNDAFTKAGYTEKDYNEDKAAATGESEENITFTIPLEYRLDGDSLVVTVPTKEIKETGEAKLANIEMLRFFGAAGTNENGYMLVPNGSGSLINFNNGKKNEQYNQYVYGMDPVSMGYTVVESTEKARLPIFGIKRDNSAIFASIESGDTVSNIIADVSGKLNSYNYVYPTFHIREGEKLSMFGTTGASSELPVVEKNFYKLDLTVKYSFLKKDEASYSGMANHYRNELIEKGVLSKKQNDSKLPFYLDILGGVRKKEFIAGVPHNTVYPMTTFNQAKDIIDKFYDADIKNLRVNYKGWFNGGYYNSVSNKIKVMKKLGGKSDLEDLTNYIEKEGGKLFVDTAFQNVTYSSSKFNYMLEASRYYTGRAVMYGKVNPGTLRQTSDLGGYSELLYYVMSPKFLVRYVDSFSNKIKNYNVTGVSLRDLGDVLQSDKRRTEIINREEAKYVVKNELNTLKETNKDLMIKGGNYYSLGYATDLTDVPTSANEFYIIDQEVPFYEMVLHGCVDYTGSSINLNDSYNKQDILLKMIEDGAAPHFILSYKSSSNIKYTGTNDMYATYYKNWINDAKDIYISVNEVLKNVENSNIINHEILDNSLVKVTYDNGVIIYINKGNESVAADGITVNAKSYVVKGVE
ncbi:DUF5696 domain-containing protein [Anaeromicropila herbilytica]|uniref:Uncharacterized protein n=1 Tax=Anaeromicropila herbilytica TaxID=2785025 RepID=A0A7R7ID39_9FIRM|nr:DUF5696 domain-containing protein [Anaeromicropila herbilytica]BCN29633.1 hypothetical protein bsdtb5_09280 [Anaeromicropila herbilytica]